MTGTNRARSMVASYRRRAGSSEAGQAAGLETIPFGIIVFVGGLLLMVNLWAVVDTRAALDSAARDYLRAYTSSADSATGRRRGTAAVEASMTGRNGTAGSVRITNPAAPFGPCRPATVVLRLEVPAFRAPFIGSIGNTVVSTTQTELVQPFGTATDEGAALGATPCDG